ncbi:MAG: hypothetical protein WCO23_00505 [bacterium]
MDREYIQPIDNIDSIVETTNDQRIVNLRAEQQELIRKKAQIDEKIYQIQRSTRVTFRVFCRLHNFLRTHSTWYYNWHLWPYSESTHIIILLLFVFWQIYRLVNPLLILI